MEPFNHDDIVWAKMKGSPLWPGKIARPKPNYPAPYEPGKTQHFVYFYGSGNFAWIWEKDIVHHSDSELQKFNKKKKPPVNLKKGVKELTDELALEAKLLKVMNEDGISLEEAKLKIGQETSENKKGFKGVRKNDKQTNEKQGVKEKALIEKDIKHIGKKTDTNSKECNSEKNAESLQKPDNKPGLMQNVFVKEKVLSDTSSLGESKHVGENDKEISKIPKVKKQEITETNNYISRVVDKVEKLTKTTRNKEEGRRLEEDNQSIGNNDDKETHERQGVKEKVLIDEHTKYINKEVKKVVGKETQKDSKKDNSEKKEENLQKTKMQTVTKKKIFEGTGGIVVLQDGKKYNAIKLDINELIKYKNIKLITNKSTDKTFLQTQEQSFRNNQVKENDQNLSQPIQESCPSKNGKQSVSESQIDVSINYKETFLENQEQSLSINQVEKKDIQFDSTSLPSLTAKNDLNPFQEICPSKKRKRSISESQILDVSKSNKEPFQNQEQSQKNIQVEKETQFYSTSLPKSKSPTTKNDLHLSQSFQESYISKNQEQSNNESNDCAKKVKKDEMMKIPNIFTPSQRPRINMSKFPIKLKTPGFKPTEKKIGFIGCSLFANILIKNLILSEHKVTLWEHSEADFAVFFHSGASKVHSFDKLVDNCDIIFFCNLDWKVSQELLKNGNINNKRNGYVFMDNMPQDGSDYLADLIKKSNGQYLEAPVLGTMNDANMAVLSIFSAGNHDLFRECQTCFFALSERVYWLNDCPGLGNEVIRSLSNGHEISSKIDKPCYITSFTNITQDDFK